MENTLNYEPDIGDCFKNNLSVLKEDEALHVAVQRIAAREASCNYSQNRKSGTSEADVNRIMNQVIATGSFNENGYYTDGPKKGKHIIEVPIKLRILEREVSRISEYEIVYGWHRTEACRRLGVKFIPAQITGKTWADDGEELFIDQVDENLDTDLPKKPADKATMKLNIETFFEKVKNGEWKKQKFPKDWQDLHTQYKKLRQGTASTKGGVFDVFEECIRKVSKTTTFDDNEVRSIAKSFVDDQVSSRFETGSAKSSGNSLRGLIGSNKEYHNADIWGWSGDQIEYYVLGPGLAKKEMHGIKKNVIVLNLLNLGGLNEKQFHDRREKSIKTLNKYLSSFPNMVDELWLAPQVKGKNNGKPKEQGFFKVPVKKNSDVEQKNDKTPLQFDYENLPRRKGWKTKHTL